MGGPDLRIAAETWRKLAESEARLHLMVELGQLEVGFPDVENFWMGLLLLGLQQVQHLVLLHHHHPHGLHQVQYRTLLARERGKRG